MKKASQLIAQLAVVDENMRAEVINQPVLFVDAVRYRVSKMRQKAQAEAELEYFDSLLGLSIRAKKHVAGEKATEGYYKARLLKHPKHRALQAALSRAEAREEFSKGIVEAYRMRRDALKILADAQGYESMRAVSEVEKATAYRRLSIEARKLQDSRRRTGED